MTVAFELTMPCVASWNGRWSGEERVHAVVETFRSALFMNLIVIVVLIVLGAVTLVSL